ncbi:MAG: asparagine synthase (glutamine-hydrolyzing) [Natronomonas sp.]|jgi:asparagine synthase (glutamine-hydrolysing)|uniref:asparagine synthase C-terminal domain-containing protein n=1 Tax=Natronomonas sp. TaxID=2184060 RepID=UPI00398A148D
MQGADPAVVRQALDTREPLPGTDGFAGELDGALVRDVLGRYPLFSEADDHTEWSVDPTDLNSPEPVPAGHQRGADGDTRVWTLPNPDPYANDNRAIDAVRSAVIESVDEVGGSPAIAFSGGIDSSILAARLDGPLYVGGFEDSHDVEAARSAAEALDRAVRVVEFSHDDLERAVPEIVRATGRSNPMDVQISLPLYLVAERVAADGHEHLAVGQGADELFGGYAKVSRAPEEERMEAETIRGAIREMIASLPAQLERDVLTLRAAGVEPVAPLLHDRVVETALRLPGDLLVRSGPTDDGDGEVRKVALRQAADFLPDEIRRRDKKAVQYGSLVAREFDRLARQAGFKRRMDDHVGQYIDSLVE